MSNNGVPHKHHCGACIPPAVGMGGRTYYCLEEDSQCEACRVLDLEDEVERLRFMFRDLCAGHEDDCKCRYCVEAFKT